MYQQYFGLTSEPFPANLSPDALFRSQSSLSLQNRFDHLCTYRGIMLLTGSPGSGKTTSLRSLLTRVSKKLFFPVYLPLSTVSVFEFYRQINDALGGEVCYYKTDIYRSIQNEILKKVEQKSIVPIIALDEAHLLKEQNFKELQLIINFEMDSVMPFILILAGHPVLAKRLQSYSLDSLNQRIALKHNMEPLTEPETKQFIAMAFKRCGATKNLITNEACLIVHQKSRGLPRMIGAIITKALISCAYAKIEYVGEEEIFIAAKEILG